MRMPILSASLLLASLVLTGCDLAPPPPTDPDATAKAKDASKPQELQHAIDSVDYRDRAKAAGDTTLEADKKHDQELKDQGG
jgi:hypothetical protein